MLRRLLRTSLLLGATLLAGQTAQAEIDNQLFTSTRHRIKLTVPKGWRPSELPSYPGVILWMLRSQPEGRIVVGSEPLRQELFCSWPAECRKLPKPLVERYACALKARLDKQALLMGEPQSGPKETAAGGLPSVWFDFTDGERYVRQALAVNDRRVVVLALSTGSASDRATHSRAFDQALRSLRELSEAEVQSESSSSSAGASGEAPASSPAATTPPGASTAPAAPGISPLTSPAAVAEPAAPAPSDFSSLELPLFNASCPCPVDPARPCPATAAAAR